MKQLTISQVIIRVSAIIAMVEFLIMLTLQTLPFQLNTIVEALIDVIMLTIASTPFIYLWVIKPFVQARDEALIQISQLAYSDPLTHLANRRHFLTHLEMAIPNIARKKVYGAILAVDLDDFKQVNDSYGHEAGDAVLVEIANRFKSILRSGDMVGRMGGDEFVLLADQLDADKHIAQDKAMIIADKLINLAKQPIDYNGFQLLVGASIGIYTLGGNVTNIDTIMSRADNAMYSAKKSGKGRSVFFD